MGVTVRAAGNGQHSHGGRRRNAYVPLLVIIAMVCGSGLLLGVVGLQRMKERRDLDRLIREKDGQILSLHLLLQKEKGHSQEIKRKTEEMRTKVRTLRARNSNLSARISDMESTISSLRDEQRAIELHLHETRNDAKSALTEISLRKESEIEDLKSRLKSCPETQNEPPISKANQTHYEEKSNDKREDNALPLRNDSMFSEEQSEYGQDIEKNEHENDRESRPGGDDNGKMNHTGVGEFSKKEAKRGKTSSFNRETGIDGSRFRGKRAFLKRIDEGKSGDYLDSGMRAAKEDPSLVIETQNSTKTGDAENMKETGVSDLDEMSEHEGDGREGAEVSGTNEDDVQMDDFPDM